MLRLATIALALIALIAAGCGDDDEDPAQTTTSPAQTESTGSPTDTKTTAGESDPGQTDDGGGGEGTIARAEFIRRADKVCAGARAQIVQNGQQIGEALRDASKGKTAAAEYFRAAARLTGLSAEAADDAIAQLEALPDPDSRKDALDRYLAGTRAQAANLHGQAEALKKRDQAAVARLNQKATKTSAQLAAASKDFGFQVCGNPRA